MKSFSNQENFYKRLRELSDVDARSKSTSLDNQTLIEYSRANDGSALGIIKEDSSFYMKSSNTQGEIAVEHFTYIGGLENKLKYKFETLSEATRVKNYYVNALNESLERKFNPAKTLNEEKELLSISNGEKGGIANAQTVADKAPKGETLKDSAQEKKVADPVSKDGIAKAQSEGDKNKSDDAGSKLKQGHEASTATGKSREDIAKAQANADATTKGTAIKNSAAQKEIAKPEAKNSGAAKAQGEADKNKSEDKSAGIKDSAKEVKPASDAKKEKAIVVENFGEVAPDEEQQDAAPEIGGAPDAAASAEAPPTGGEENADLDAAASALDALDITADAGDATASAEAPAADASIGGGSDMGAEAPADDASGLDAGSGDASVDTGNDDAALKDIEKLVGKTGQKIRSTELSDEMVGGFLKSIISSFEGKLSNLDSDLKRELSNKILKAGEEGEESNGAPESLSTAPSNDAEGGSSAEEAPVDEMAIPEDHEIEEAINQHLAEMGMADQGGSTAVAPVGGAAPAAAPAQQQQQGGSQFKSYMAERGYNPENVNEVSIMEMVSLVNGYANECGDNYANADMQTIAEYMSPEVKEGVVESGFGKFAEGVEVFSVKPKSYKSKEPVLEYGDEHAVSTADALAGKQPVQEWNFDKKGGDDKDKDEKKDEKKDKFSFAKPAESLNKSEKEEKKEEKEDVSESAKIKLRAIINTKIQEQLGLKKPSINENAKSAFSKKLDEMIASEINKGREALKVKRATNTQKVF